MCLAGRPGRDSYREFLRERARRAGAAERVELAAAVAPGEVLDAITAADIGLMLIQPVCRSYELTLPNKLFEYAAAGVPILASDLPVIGPIVREERIGEVVRATDVEEIARGLRRLAQPRLNAELRERVRAFARRASWAQERLTLERVYRELV